LTYLPQGYAVDPVWLSRLDEPERVTLGDFVRSAIVHALLPGQRSAFAPLAPADLAWAQTQLLSGGGLVEAVSRDLSARCDALGLGRHTQALAESVLTRMRVELLGLERDGEAIDLRRVGGFVTVQSISMWLTVESKD
jgi:hypothetical protein